MAIYIPEMIHSNKLARLLVCTRNPDPLLCPTVQETLPERLGQYEYWTRQTQDAPQPTLLRRQLAETSSGFYTCYSDTPSGGKLGATEVLLDSNDLSHVPSGCDLGQVSIVP